MGREERKDVHFPGLLNGSSMTTDQIISASSSVGTFLAAIATFMTITQISRQRRASYQPDLAFSRVDFEASNDKSSLPLGWKKPKTQDDLRLSLINLGLGAAKNVWLRWSFPIDESVRQITQLGKQPPFDAPSAFLLDDQLIINLEHT